MIIIKKFIKFGKKKSTVLIGGFEDNIKRICIDTNQNIFKNYLSPNCKKQLYKLTENKNERKILL